MKNAEVKNADLLIGAVQNDQIHPISEFAEKNKIRYVIPFTSKNDDVLSNAYVFQVNTPHSYLYSKAAQAGYELFKNYNIVLLNTNDSQDDKKDFIKALKAELKQYRNLNEYADFIDNTRLILTILDSPMPVFSASVFRNIVSRITVTHETLRFQLVNGLELEEERISGG